MNTKRSDSHLICPSIVMCLVSLLLLFVTLIASSCSGPTQTNEEKIDRDQSILQELTLDGGAFEPSAQGRDPVLEELHEDGYRAYENETYLVFFANKSDKVFSIECKDQLEASPQAADKERAFYEEESSRLYQAMHELASLDNNIEQHIEQTDTLTRVELSSAENNIIGAFTFDATGKLMLATIDDEHGVEEAEISANMALDLAKVAVLSDQKLNQYEWDFLPMTDMPRIEKDQDAQEWRVDIPVAIHGALEGTSQALTVYLDADTGKTNAVFSSLN